MGRRFILLDRDGVINAYRRNEYVNRREDFAFVPGTLDALKMLNDAGYEIVVISNQGGVGKGLMTEEMLADITACMMEGIEAHGARVAEVFYCVHAPGTDCDCRKPQPGLIRRAAAKYGFDPKECWFVGDNRSDIETGHNAGCRTALVLTGNAGADEVPAWPRQPDFVAPDLLAAVRRILADAGTI